MKMNTRELYILKTSKHHNKVKNGTVRKTVNHILISWVDQLFHLFQYLNWR